MVSYKTGYMIYVMSYEARSHVCKTN